MDRRVARLNIEHFTKLLRIETDAAKRAEIEFLLAREKLRLAALTKAEQSAAKPPPK